MPKTALGLNTSYLVSLGEQLLPHFSGVTSCDMIKSIFPTYDVNRSCVINTLEKHFKKGGHWIALFFNASKKCLYYWDPYGLKPSNHHILKFLNESAKKNIKVKYYPQSVQGLFSVFCGYHVLSFLIHKETNMSAKDFFQIYDYQKLHLNDEISAMFIQMYITHHQARASGQQLTRPQSLT